MMNVMMNVMHVRVGQVALRRGTLRSSQSIIRAIIHHRTEYLQAAPVQCAVLC